MGTTSSDLLLVLDRSRSRSLRAQIEGELRRAIRGGRLQPGSVLPSTRTLAVDLGITRGVVVDFYAGQPDLDMFPRTAWAKATRTALHTMPTSDLAYGHFQGIPSLRHELTDYLGRVRGVDTKPEHILVGHGFNHVFGLVSRVLHDSGLKVFAVEDPG